MIIAQIPDTHLAFDGYPPNMRRPVYVVHQFIRLGVLSPKHGFRARARADGAYVRLIRKRKVSPIRDASSSLLPVFRQ